MSTKETADESLNAESQEYFTFDSSQLEELDVDFDDISEEEERVYQFDNAVLTIENPIGLAEQERGGHRIIDACGKVYEIYPKWNYIAWRRDEGPPEFTE